MDEITVISNTEKADDPFFITTLEYSAEEETKVIRILDTRLFPWILLTTFVLNMDRTNHSNAISDGLPADLGFGITAVNTGLIVYAIFFSAFTLTGSVIAKHAGPSRWISILMFAWSLVTLSHALIKNRAGYWTVRAWIAITEGGAIPATLVYLGGFYKSNELATRLGWFWGIQNIASAVSGLMASGLLQLQGVRGLEGWRWLFIVDDGQNANAYPHLLLHRFYLPRNATSTRGGLRGFRPWFTERQIHIAVTRIIRDDPAKRYYETPVSWSDVKDAVTDLALWGHLIITVIGLTPTTPLSTYLPTVIKSFNFNVFVANALTAPPFVLQCVSTVFLTWNSDRTGERGLHGAFGAAWQFVGWILLRALPSSAARGVKYFSALVVASWALTHPLNIAWMSENMGSVGKKTIASGAVIGFANIYSTWGSQIYQAKDSPDFRTGNTINIAFAGVALILWFVQKYSYQFVNSRREEKWRALSEIDKKEQLHEAEQLGNRALNFRFTT
ncbi:MFS general substrate transporter [Ramaria rubella]|nr:MFS general substrate transporter [Ramaria rubella]